MGAGSTTARRPFAGPGPDDADGATRLTVCRYRGLRRIGRCRASCIGDESRGMSGLMFTAAIARELAGFIWAIARRVPPAAG